MLAPCDALLTRRAVNWFVDEIKAYTPYRGGVFAPTLQTLTANVPEGELIGATPDGRRAGEPTSDNASPAAGTDLAGITAAVKSVAKLEHARHPNGTLFNLRIHPSAVEGEGGLEKFAALIRTFFELGGMQMQFNVISTETLKDAMENPENHRNLMVRISGYNAYFVELNHDLQMELIERTEHALGQ